MREELKKHINIPEDMVDDFLLDIKQKYDDYNIFKFLRNVNIFLVLVHFISFITLKNTYFITTFTCGISIYMLVMTQSKYVDYKKSYKLYSFLVNKQNKIK